MMFFFENIRPGERSSTDYYDIYTFDNLIRHEDYRKIYSEKTIAVWTAIIGFYQKTALAVLLLTVFFSIIYLIGAIGDIRRKQYEVLNLFLFWIGVIGLFLILTGGISIFTEWLYYLDGTRTRFTFYAIGAIPLYQTISFISILQGIKYLMGLEWPAKNK